MSSQKIIGTATTYIAAVALVMFVVNAWLIHDTRATQLDVNQRQAEVNEGIQLSQLNNQVVRALANAVITKKDKQIQDMLQTNGITIDVEKAAAEAAAAKKQ